MRTICFRVLVVTFVAAAAFADETRDKLAEINSQVEAEITRLDAVSLEVSVNELEYKQVQKNLDQLKNKERDLQSDLDRLKASQSELSQAIDAGQAELERVKIQSNRRLRALYMFSGEDVAENFLLHKASVDIGRNIFYFGRIRAYDARLRNNLESRRQEHVARVAELEQLQKKNLDLRTRLAAQRAKVADKAAEKGRILQELTTKKSQSEAVIAELRAQALRLETVVASLTGGRITHEPGETPEPKVPATDTPRDNGPYNGPGLQPTSVKLVLPVVGRVVKAFGKQRLTGFSAFVFSKGVEYLAATGAPISAIAIGRVMFLGKMPGYGTMLILDHGQRYYSLYGKLGQVVAKPGEVVEAGSTLGTTSAPEGESGNFYFELRKEGKPIDPGSYLRRTRRP